MHIGESTGDAVIVETEFLMIESKQMECCRMEIIRKTGILCRLKTKFVRTAVGGTSSARATDHAIGISRTIARDSRSCNSMTDRS